MPRMALLGLTLALALVAASNADEAADASPADSLLDDCWAAAELETPAAAPAEETRPLAREGTHVTRNEVARRSDTGRTGTWVRTTMSLGGVVALICLLAWGYKRVASSGSLRMALRTRQPALLEVVGRTMLSPKQTVCLVRVGPRLVLLGCTADAIRPLDVISDDDHVARILGQAAQQGNDSHVAEFAQCLETEADAYGEKTNGLEDETTMPEDTRLRAVKDRLTGTIERLRSSVA